MERNSSPRKNTEQEGLWSCWGRLKLKLPWSKRRAAQRSGFWNLTSAFKSKQPKPGGGFRYDPLSYAQNFDEGAWDDDNEDSLRRGFSSRFASTSSKSIADK